METAIAPCDHIALLERQLAARRSRYTENHPDVIAVRQEIAELRDSIPTDEVCAPSQGATNQIRVR